MTLLYLTTVGASNFVRAGMGRDIKNVPPFILSLCGLLALMLTPSLRLALLLRLSRSLLRLSFLFGLLISLTLLGVMLS